MAVKKFDVAEDIGAENTERKKEELNNEAETAPEHTPEAIEKFLKQSPEAIEKLLKQSQKILDKLEKDGSKEVKRGRPRLAESEKKRQYRYNLSLDGDLKEYLDDVAWRKRTSKTQYLNDLIRREMENDEEWKKMKK